MKKFIACFIFLVCVTTVTPDSLICYDCGPSSKGRCLSPYENNIKLTTCPQTSSAGESGVKKEIDDTDLLDIKGGDNVTETINECYTLYFESSDERLGVYRGCFPRPINVASSCEILTENLQGGNVTECKTCGENECNKENDVGGGAAGLTICFGIMVLSLIVHFNIF